MAKAEGVAAPYVEARKQFETRHKQMKIWEKLAADKDLVIQGEENPELNTCALGRDVAAFFSAGLRVAGVRRRCWRRRGSKVMLNLDKSGSAL